MAWWVVRQELKALDLAAYEETAWQIAQQVEGEVRDLYRTHCRGCGGDVPVKYFLWVKTRTCGRCGRGFDLFPGYLIAAAGRHPRNVVLCAACGELEEVGERRAPGDCSACGVPLVVDGPSSRNRCCCPHCSKEQPYSEPDAAPPQHRLIALEYHCGTCKKDRRGRFFKRPDDEDLARFGVAERRLSNTDPRYVPNDPIPPGDETARLHRWGYRRWSDLFNSRQLLGLELLARRIAEVDSTTVREALATNFSDLLRYQNMLCRYDTRALKSLDVFSVHGFPVGLIQCESNLLGIRGGRGGNVGSGGWSNMVAKFLQAKRYCERPFEMRYEGSRRVKVPVPGEWIGDRSGKMEREVQLRCESSGETQLEDGSLDAVLTDPPYLANVQYAELMDFCYAWLRRLVGADYPEFHLPSTHRSGDLTGNQTLERGLKQFTAGLSRVFGRFARALVRGGPFVFTYHHNDLAAYLPVAVALLDARLTCTAVFPCPAEMGGSIHIYRTESSILDSVFVCRTLGRVQRRSVEATTAEEVARLIADDLSLLRAGGVEPTRGDARCLAFGHLVRLMVWRLKSRWEPEDPWGRKLALVESALDDLAGWEEIWAILEMDGEIGSRRQCSEIRERSVVYELSPGESDMLEFEPSVKGVTSSFGGSVRD